MRIPVLMLAVLFVGCDAPKLEVESPDVSLEPPKQSLRDARDGFVTKLVSSGEQEGPPATPVGKVVELIHYQAPAGQLAAYLTPDPGDGKKHPAIVWITGGDTNSIGDVWSPSPRTNDQSARAFREAGIVMMYPSQRGGNDNPGRREGFLGEVEDVLAATDHLTNLSYVDEDQLYLGGHSTGGTLVMLIGASTDRYRAVFSLGPVAAAAQYGGNLVYCDPDNEEEMTLRSPHLWLHSVKNPMYVFEGAENGNWEGAVKIMANENLNPKIHFFKVTGQNHFSLIAPLTEILANQIIQGRIEVTDSTLQGLH